MKIDSVVPILPDNMNSEYSIFFPAMKILEFPLYTVSLV